jgi:hypothetical protein
LNQAGGFLCLGGKDVSTYFENLDGLTYCTVFGGLSRPSSNRDGTYPGCDRGDSRVPTTAPTTITDESFSCTAVSEIPTAECQALVTFYEATDGPNWVDNTGWLETTTPCSWYGLTCAGSHVDTLSLFYNDLQGQLPAALADLPQLRVLDLHNNAIPCPLIVMPRSSEASLRPQHISNFLSRSAEESLRICCFVGIPRSEDFARNDKFQFEILPMERI